MRASKVSGESPTQPDRDGHPTSVLQNVNKESAWNDGIEGDHTTQKKSQAQEDDDLVIHIGAGHSEESSSDSDASNTTNSPAASASQQMSQSMVATPAVLPHTNSRRQACQTSWRNLPYKKTVLVSGLSLAAMAFADFNLNNFSIWRAQNDEENSMKIVGYVATYILQVLSIVGAISAYKSFTEKR